MCDLNDDCGDNSDESDEICGNYTLRADFEYDSPGGNEVHGNGLFSQVDKVTGADFKWKIGSGITINRNTGTTL